MKRAVVSFLLWSFVCSAHGTADSETAVRVLGYAEHNHGNVVYHYRVINNVQDKIGVVTIGFDAAPEVDSFELNELPLGWALDSGTPAASVTAPYGWEAEAMLQEDSLFRAMEWSVSDLYATYIVPGQTMDGMSVTVRVADMAYLKSHANIVFSSGYTSPLTVTIESLDVTAPQLSVTLNPIKVWPPNGKMITIAATVSAKDDYDGEPEIKLESITANEPLGADDIADAQFGTDDRQFQLKADRLGEDREGRVYTVTYSATDATGNKSTASATVTVSHDVRR